MYNNNVTIGIGQQNILLMNYDHKNRGGKPSKITNNKTNKIYLRRTKNLFGRNWGLGMCGELLIRAQFMVVLIEVATTLPADK
jgi:hypothetical protein